MRRFHRSSKHLAFIFIAVSGQWLATAQSCYSQVMTPELVSELKSKLSLNKLNDKPLAYLIRTLNQLDREAQDWDSEKMTVRLVVESLNEILETGETNSEFQGVQYGRALDYVRHLSAADFECIPEELTVAQLWSVQDTIGSYKLRVDIAGMGNKEGVGLGPEPKLHKRNWIETSTLTGSSRSLSWPLSWAASVVDWAFLENYEYIGIAIFEPKMRIYFDVSPADSKKIDAKGDVVRDGDVDLFQDGSLLPALELVELQLRNQIGNQDSPWFWGPNLGVGISSGGFVKVETTVRDESGGTDETRIEKSTESLNSAALLVDVGMSIDYLLNPKNFESTSSVSMEVGYTFGFSAEENLNSFDDGAIFVGIVFSAEF